MNLIWDMRVIFYACLLFSQFSYRNMKMWALFHTIIAARLPFEIIRFFKFKTAMGFS